MSKQLEAEVAAMLMKFCVGRGVQWTREAAQMNASYLIKKGYDKNQISKAVGEMFGDASVRLPTAAEVIKRLKSSNAEIEIDAVGMAGEIIAAISDYGQYNSKEARNFLGEEAWGAVERYGGWTALTRLEYSQLNTARAQLVKLCTFVIKQKEKGFDLIQGEKNKNLSRPDYSELLKLTTEGA